jgi:hypothetical protein
MGIVGRSCQVCAIHLLVAAPLFAQAPAPQPAPATPASPATPAPRVRVAPLRTPRARQAPTPRAGAPATTNADVRSLSIVLLSGEMEGPAVSDDVPMAARKAIEDLRDFLPFKSYRLYDSGVVGVPSDTLPAVVRLRGGTGPQLFEATVSKPPASPSLDVALRDLVTSQTTKGASGLPLATVMSASIRVNNGESVVVGTSRIRGDRALVLVITGLASGARPEAARSDGRTLTFPDGKELYVPAAPRFAQPAQPPQPPQPPQPAQRAQPLQPRVQPQFSIPALRRLLPPEPPAPAPPPQAAPLAPAPPVSPPAPPVRPAPAIPSAAPSSPQ